MTLRDTLDPESLVYDDRGLLPVVVQEVVTGAVLMLAWADREAVRLTLETGRAHFWSRSRRKLWKKGETSGNELVVDEVLVDCDRDSLLVRAHPLGPTCHEGTRSCFEPNPAQLELGWLARVLEKRRDAGQESYTARLWNAGPERIAQKVGEEAVETVIAALGTGEAADARLASESADFLYHWLLLLATRGAAPSDVAAVLRERRLASGDGGGG